MAAQGATQPPTRQQSCDASSRIVTSVDVMLRPAVVCAAMGVWNLFKKDERRKRAETAAAQIYAALCAGAKLEIPQSLSTDDPVAQAILVLRKKYPDAVVTMLQSKTLILSRGNAAKAAMAQQAWQVLDAHGYFPDTRLPPEALFTAHEKFMERSGGTTVEDAKRLAEEEARRDTRIEVVGG